MSIEQGVKTARKDLRNISGLVGDAMTQFAKLFQSEVDLAKAELGEKIQKLGGALGLIAGGAVLIFPAIVMALFALSSALIAAGWSQPLNSSQLDPTLRNFVEFRHKSWWNKEVYAAFRRAGMIVRCSSGPRLPDELLKTTDEVYLWLHGPLRGIGTTTPTRSSRNGREESKDAARTGPGSTSTTTTEPMPPKRRTVCFRRRK
jgi:hypothetical protein